MSSNMLGERFTIVTFGESHGPAVGVVVDGVMPGLPLTEADIQAELDRRRPGQSGLTSPRVEPDRAEILSGVFEGRTTGAPICIIVRNRDARPSDYDEMRDLFRPGHGDFTWLAKYGIRDHRGGGRLSGRETVARVAAGAVARRMLARHGVQVVGHTLAVGGVRATTFDEAVIETNPVRCADPVAAKAMAAVIEEAARAGDSVGGIVEVRATGVPAGWGDPVFRKLDALLAQAMMSIGGVKGVEIGDGFAAATMRGSQHNDPLTPEGFASNRAGGILGGISNGAPIVVRLAVKPTSSIALPQRTTDRWGRPREIRVRGRHDPCLCPRVVPVAEAMMALVLADACLAQQAIAGEPVRIEDLRAAIDLADADLVLCLARRFGLVREVARVKRSHGAPIRCPEREAEVSRRWLRLARGLGLDETAATTVLQAVLDASRNLQQT